MPATYMIRHPTPPLRSFLILFQLPAAAIIFGESENPHSTTAAPMPAWVASGREVVPSSGLGRKLFAVSGADRADNRNANGASKDGDTGGIVQEGSRMWVRQASLNEVMQYLAELGGFQYFHNTEAEGPAFIVTGHLNEGDALEQMQELGLMYGLTVYQKGSTVYALTQSQLGKLPQQPMQYQLKYLRPTDIEQIKVLLTPVLTPGSGVVDYEPKTNTLIVYDNEQRIDGVRAILEQMDQPKQQIAIETKILRVKSFTHNRIGVDWESVLGDGLTVEAIGALNTLFNLPESDTVGQVIRGTSSSPGGSSRTVETLRTVERNNSGLVLSPVQLRAVIRALNSGNLAEQESCPTLITEDNEEGLITIIDRVPIIVTTISETDFGQNISEEVRYRVDPEDSVELETTREIGVTVSVTPTILPDNTVRMLLRPRTAQIVEFVEGQTGNRYPRVNESTIQTIARVPNGHSLLIGGVYDVASVDKVNKVPGLGDLPLGNLLFKSTDRSKEQTSLVFVVTPTTYEPVSIPENDGITRYLHEKHVLPPDHASPDPRNPGFNHQSRPGNALANLFKRHAPTPPGNTLHPEHPVHQEPVPDSEYNQVLRLRNIPFSAQRLRIFKGREKNYRGDADPLETDPVSEAVPVR